ncbi:MAG: branched-chain-amino-acid transaminase [Aigarchaeota archaeon]|nr:branched-chain-amino-acid transaminase [Aigarchaeota archaeon]MDW8092740.1 branched-chain-amino-acid transaminase [Nitrososphaerota archaeon]
MTSQETLVYIDGEFYPRSNAKISVFDHGVLYGDGVFEGIRCYNGVVFKLIEHLERLYASAKAIRLNIPLTIDELKDAVIKTLRVNGLRDAYIRLVVTRGVGDLGLDPRKCGRPTVFIIAERMDPILGSVAKERGVRVIISSIRRDSIASTSHEIKSLNYLNSILAKLEAINANSDDAIMLDANGFVSEATGANVFIVKNRALHTPPVTAAILPGITRRFVMELASSKGIKTYERDITPTELVLADEVFLTGTGAEIVPVVNVNGVSIGEGRPGEVTKTIMEEFDRRKVLPSEGTPID